MIITILHEERKCAMNPRSEKLSQRTIKLIERHRVIVLRKDNMNSEAKNWYLGQHTNIAAGPDYASWVSHPNSALEFHNLEWAFTIAPLYNCKVVTVKKSLKKKEKTEKAETSPSLYGVWCEPTAKNVDARPYWLNNGKSLPTPSYEEARYHCKIWNDYDTGWWLYSVKSYPDPTLVYGIWCEPTKYNGIGRPQWMRAKEKSYFSYQEALDLVKPNNSDWTYTIKPYE
jgi:hypothetical protein